MSAPAIITTKEVMRRTGLSRRTLLRRRKNGKFPEPINIGEGVHGMLGYFEDEISDWVASRPRAAALNPPKTIKEAELDSYAGGLLGEPMKHSSEAVAHQHRLEGDV